MAKKPKPLPFPNPVNSNAALNAKHTIYVAGTGGGKTSAVFATDFIPKSAQVVIFDPYKGYVGRKLKGQKVLGTESRAKFVKALLSARRSGKPFKLAYLPKHGACDEELESFRRWCGRWVMAKLQSCTPLLRSLHRVRKPRVNSKARRASCYVAVVSSVWWCIPCFKRRKKS